MVETETHGSPITHDSLSLHLRSQSFQQTESGCLSSQRKKIYLLYLCPESLNIGASEEHLKAPLIWSDVSSPPSFSASILPVLLVFILILLSNVPPLSPSVCITLSFLFFRLSIFFWSLYAPTLSFCLCCSICFFIFCTSLPFSSSSQEPEMTHSHFIHTAENHIHIASVSFTGNDILRP